MTANQSSALIAIPVFLVTIFLPLPLLECPTLEVDVQRQGQADKGARSREEHIDGHRVSLQRSMREGVQGRLDNVGEARGTGDGAVDATERGEAEDFGNVVSG